MSADDLVHFDRAGRGKCFLWFHSFEKVEDHEWWRVEECKDCGKRREMSEPYDPDGRLY